MLDEIKEFRKTVYGTAPAKVTGTPIVAALLSIVGLVLLVVGGLALTPATLGVGLIGAAAFFAVLARIIQADRHHREQMVLPEK